MVLTNNYKVWTYGDNGVGQLGRATKSRTAKLPGIVKLPKGSKTPIQIACTGFASFVLTDAGVVYGWGVFTEGAKNEVIGFSPTVEKQLKPVKIFGSPGRDRVVKLIAGGEHVVCILNVSLCLPV